MHRRWFPAFILVHCLLLGIGCRDDPEPPSQQAVDEAWRRADQAIHQSATAQADVKHIARLRDIDRLRYQADVAELSTQVSTLRGLVIVLMLALLAALIWLAVEIRRRRVLSAVMRFAEPPDDARRPAGSPELEPPPVDSLSSTP